MIPIYKKVLLYLAIFSTFLIFLGGMGALIDTRLGALFVVGILLAIACVLVDWLFHMAHLIKEAIL